MVHFNIAEATNTVSNIDSQPFKPTKFPVPSDSAVYEEGPAYE